jgi:CPA2 family monovalent cation:H+ antiporter-2
MEQRNDPLAVLPMSTDLSKLTGHVLLVGYGKLGRRLGAALASQGRSLVVAEENREVVEELRERNIPAVSGDASDPAVLVQAHVARAKVLLITTPDVLKARRMVEVARMLNPDIEVLIHARNADEAALLRAERVGEVVLAEEALEAMVDAHLKSRAQGR